MTTPPSQRSFSNLAMRLATAAAMAPVLLWLLFLAPEWCLIGFIGIVSMISSLELMAMTLGRSPWLQVWGVVASAGVLAAFGIVTSTEAQFGALLVLVLGAMGLSLIFVEPVEQAAQRTAWLIAGPLYVGGLLASFLLLHRADHGGAWLLLAMLIAWFGDTGGYFAGKLLGRRKLYERISPKKTVEGSVGGLFGSVVGAVLAHAWFLRELPLGEGIGLALAAGAAGQVGDLCESLIKRSTGVKDSGRIVPGHGGLLDRIDALMFAVPVVWVYVVWLK